MQIELANVSYYRDQRLILDDIGLTVQSGECITIAGRSGSGKSLLFSILCGVTAATQGQLLVDGLTIDAMTDSQYYAYRQQLGVIFQVPALLANLTLNENLMLPLNQYYCQWSLAQKRQHIETIAYEYGLSEYLDWRIGQLSNGIAALGAFARALLLRPSCLIWDAPLADIDDQWADQIIAKLANLKATGLTLILFTNRQSLIDSLADRRFLIELRHLKETHAA